MPEAENPGGKDRNQALGTRFDPDYLLWKEELFRRGRFDLNPQEGLLR